MEKDGTIIANGFVWRSRAPLAEGLAGFLCILCPHFLSGWIASLFAVTWTSFPCRPTGASCFRDLDRLSPGGWPWWICLQFRKICWWREKPSMRCWDIKHLLYPDAKGPFRIPCRCQHGVFVAKFGLMRNYVINFTMVGKFSFGTGMNCYVWFPGFWSMPLSFPTYSWQNFKVCCTCHGSPATTDGWLI